ncbi:MAG: peptidylprolyl isomerase [Armatimonadetes bacterium]|nr:peptidylprolyl isomerase [Armatimonadota bacterium]
MKAQIFAVIGCLTAVSLFGCAEKPEPQATTEPPKKAETTKAPDTAKPTEETGKLATEPKDGEDVAVIDTDKGKIVFMFYPQKAPKHVENFKSLANEKFYDGTRFHRCIEGFMIQGGDPNSADLGKAATWGTGGKFENGKERNVPAEFTDIHHSRGVVSMARSQDPNSASSQFFIVQANSPNLDGQYTAFGYVVSGMDAVDAIVKTGDAGDNGKVKPADAVVVKSIRIEKWPIK